MVYPPGYFTRHDVIVALNVVADPGSFLRLDHLLDDTPGEGLTVELVDETANPEHLLIQREQLKYAFSLPGFTGLIAQDLAEGYIEEDIARKRHLKPHQVYKYRDRVRKLLQQETQ